LPFSGAFFSLRVQCCLQLLIGLQERVEIGVKLLLLLGGARGCQLATLQLRATE
jgi:hypothetical protein